MTSPSLRRLCLKAWLALITQKKNVQDYLFPDGTAVRSVERRFARDLDAADEVVDYVELPWSFQIPTPADNNTPDRVITFKRGSDKHVLFVVETKSSMDAMDLLPIAQAKIACAKKLFPIRMMLTLSTMLLTLSTMLLIATRSYWSW